MKDEKRIPVVEVFNPIDGTTGAAGVRIGPGSQSELGEEVLDYMSMPSSMETYQQPILPEPEEVTNIAPALDCLTSILQGMHDCTKDRQSFTVSLKGLGPSSIELINQILGVGEVSVTIDIANQIVIQESVMAGLWRVQQLDEDNHVIDDYLEVATIPEVVKLHAFTNAQTLVDKSEDNLPQGTINSPSILVELADVATEYTAGMPAHVVNLSLLPVSPEDVLVLGERLGVGPVTILSRGYGNCRIGSTACNQVWWIKYYNSEDALILNSIEVVDMPEVAMASVEDIEDSAERLSEILAIYQ